MRTATTRRIQTNPGPLLAPESADERIAESTLFDGSLPAFPPPSDDERPWEFPALPPFPPVLPVPPPPPDFRPTRPSSACPAVPLARSLRAVECETCPPVPLPEPGLRSPVGPGIVS